MPTVSPRPTAPPIRISRVVPSRAVADWLKNAPDDELEALAAEKSAAVEEVTDPALLKMFDECEAEIKAGRVTGPVPLGSFEEFEAFIRREA